MIEDFEQRIFCFDDDKTFNDLAIEAFEYQYAKNEVYNSWCQHIKRLPKDVKTIKDIPFLPIEFFKNKKVVTSNWEDETFFQSSGTTNQKRSIHHIKSCELYIKSCVHSFSNCFGDLKDWCFLVLLPSYQTNKHSSLIFMMDYFVSQTAQNHSDFFNQDIDLLIQTLISNEQNGVKTILFGVSYALLDVIERQNLNLKHLIVFETGGMKGMRQEITKEELHLKLCDGFNVRNICSEYGMCELMSQAYSTGEGIYQTPPQMRVMIRDVNDPFSWSGTTKGAINVIDLANIHSCCFIETADLAERKSDRAFRLLGRLDYSDIRGCNLLYL
ncbi:MAG: acyltransferase [Bacteroidales bacterium]|jgi:hypothetical protein|nr:acyltransferase [Bacteroidales bacterium]